MKNDSSEQLKKYLNDIQSTHEKWSLNMNYKEKDDANTYKRIANIIIGAQTWLDSKHLQKEKVVKALTEEYRDKALQARKNEINSKTNKVITSMKVACRDMVCEFCAEQRNSLDKMVQTPPDETMIQMLSILKLRDNLDPLEVQKILPMFKNNYHAMKALQCIGKDKGIDISIPIKHDVSELSVQIDKLEKYLLGACDELGKDKKDMLKYDAFFTVDPSRKNEILDYEYAYLTQGLDSIPQLSDYKVTKGLTEVDKAKIQNYYSTLPKDPTDMQILVKTRDILAKHPEDEDILLRSEYKRAVEIAKLANEQEAKLTDPQHNS